MLNVTPTYGNLETLNEPHQGFNGTDRCLKKTTALYSYSHAVKTPTEIKSTPDFMLYMWETIGWGHCHLSDEFLSCFNLKKSPFTPKVKIKQRVPDEWENMTLMECAAF